jgi:hypothetical protein
MKRMLYPFLALWMIGLAFPMLGNAAIYYVNAAAAGANNGSSWADAYTGLQSALNKPPVSGDEIWVAEGLHKLAADKKIPLTTIPHSFNNSYPKKTVPIENAMKRLMLRFAS